MGLSSIAKRLRDEVDHSEHFSDRYHQDNHLWEAAREAADEIDRLESQYNRLYKKYWNLGGGR